MYYAIISEDVEGSAPLRQAARDQHRARLNKLLNEGRVLIAGPHPAIDSEDPGPAGFSGSLIVAEFDSLEEAKQWADHDPFTLAGVYKRVTVKPFRKIMP